MLASASHEKNAVLSILSAPPIGRSFVLGQPDARGLYHVGLSGHAWKILPSEDYAPGDRVRVISADADKLGVEKVSI